jgi:hypothetical protein
LMFICVSRLLDSTALSMPINVRMLRTLRKPIMQTFFLSSGRSDSLILTKS